MILFVHQLYFLNTYPYVILSSVSNHNGDLHCTDFQGRPVQQSEEFVPREGDPCMTCTCEDGFPVMCTSVLCSPPDCEFLEAIDGECCRFNCIEPPIENPGNGHNITGSVNTKSCKLFC